MMFFFPKADLVLDRVLRLLLGQQKKHVSSHSGGGGLQPTYSVRRVTPRSFHRDEHLGRGIDDAVPVHLARIIYPPSDRRSVQDLNRCSRLPLAPRRSRIMLPFPEHELDSFEGLVALLQSPRADVDLAMSGAEIDMAVAARRFQDRQGQAFAGKRASPPRLQDLVHLLGDEFEEDARATTDGPGHVRRDGPADLVGTEIQHEVDEGL